MTTPIAYLRRSRVDDRNPGTVSHESQLSAVRELAQRYGDTDRLRVLEDWGRSGRGERTHLRADYLALRQMIEDGEVSAVYGYSLSRLTRSLGEWTSLAALCVERGVPVRLAKDGIDLDTVSGRMVANMLAVVGQAEAEWGQERAADAILVRRARGDRMGRRPYGEKDGESVATVLDAFTEAGSFLGATKLLNERDVPARLGGKQRRRGTTDVATTPGAQWCVRTVARIVRREAPGLVPLRTRQGQRARADRIFSGLLRCHCGDLLTSMARSGSVGYYCRRAHNDPRHPRPYVVAEPKLLPWAKAEAARLHTPERVELLVDQDRKRADLEARRARVLDMYEAGDLDRDEYRRRVAAITEALETLDLERRIVAVPAIDWSWPPRELNAVLRELWQFVELDEQMKLVRAEWLVPNWRV